MKRINTLSGVVEKLKVDAILLESPLDLLYLTHVPLSYGKLFVTKDGAVLFTDHRYLLEVKVKTKIPTHLMSSENMNNFFSRKKIKRIAFIGDKTSYHHALELKENAGKIIFLSINDPLRDIRLIKDDEEIKAMKKAAKIAFSGYEYVVKHLKEGITEKEVALMFEIFCLQHGAEKLSFESIICFGKNSACPHHRCDNTKLRANDIVLMDVGVVYNGYCSDMTRTIFFHCKDKTLKYFDVCVKEAYQAAVNLCRAKTSLEMVDEAAREILATRGVKQYFLHRLGHGIGMEVHEFPRIGKDENVILQPNMLITIEPGLYKEKLGGVRYENTLLITASGYKEITALENA